MKNNNSTNKLSLCLHHVAYIKLRYLGVLDAYSGGQSWQTMLSMGIFFAWEGHIFPSLFYQE